MGLFDGAFGIGGGNKKSSTKSTGTIDQTTNTWTPEQQQAAQGLGSTLTNQLASGRQVAGMSDNEAAAQNRLGGFINNPAPAGYQQAGQTVGQLLRPGYAQRMTNPNQANQVYGQTMGRVNTDLAGTERGNIVDPAATQRLMESIKQRTMTDLGDLQSSAAKNANLSGMYFSGGHANMQTDLLKDASQNLTDQYAQLMYSDEQAKRGLEADREARDYNTIAGIIGAGQGQGYQDISDMRDIDLTAKLEGSGMAINAANAQDNAQLSRIAAGSTYGQLPRTLEQARIDAGPGSQESINNMLQYLAAQGYTNTAGTQTNKGTQKDNSFNWNMGGSSGL